MNIHILMSWHFSRKKNQSWKSFCLPICQTGKATVNLLARRTIIFEQGNLTGTTTTCFQRNLTTTCQDLVHVCHLQRSYTLCSHKSKIMYILKKQTSKKTPKATYRSASISETHILMNSSILVENCKEKLKGSHVLFSTSSACFLAFQIPNFKNCRTLLGSRN